MNRSLVLSNKEKRKEKPKRGYQKQYLIGGGIIAVFLLGLVALGILADIPDPDWDLALTATVISATNQQPIGQLDTTATANFEAQAAMPTEPQCAFMWATRIDSVAEETIRRALAPTNLTIALLQVRQNGETYCDDFSLKDVTITLDLVNETGDLWQGEDTDSIFAALPPIDNAERTILNFSLTQGGEIVLSRQYGYVDVRRAYAEGLRGDELLEMGRDGQ